MTVLYINPCFNEECYKGTALYEFLFFGSLLLASIKYNS